MSAKDRSLEEFLQGEDPIYLEVGISSTIGLFKSLSPLYSATAVNITHLAYEIAEYIKVYAEDNADSISNFDNKYYDPDEDMTLEGALDLVLSTGCVVNEGVTSNYIGLYDADYDFIPNDVFIAYQKYLELLTEAISIMIRFCYESSIISEFSYNRYTAAGFNFYVKPYH